MKQVSLNDEIKSLPESLQNEVRNFVQFLLAKHKTTEVHRPQPKKKAGLAKGLMRMSPGFDEPLEDFGDYMQ